MKDGFVKVAAGTPKIRVADTVYNANQIVSLMEEAAELGVKVLALPELCITGYTCGDLFAQSVLLDGAEDALGRILQRTARLDVLTAVGLPVRLDNKLYNCAAVIQKGRILGVIPKTYIPGYGEFYETRWFASGKDVGGGIALAGRETWLGARTVFQCRELPHLVVGVEICEDLWACEPPSTALARSGATVILNLSASNETVGKGVYRRQLVCGQSARCLAGYVYADAGEGESTSDLVFAGHNIIGENGTILAQSQWKTGLTVSEIDVDALTYERQRMNTFIPLEVTPMERVHALGTNTVPFSLMWEDTSLTRQVPSSPFVPAQAGDLARRCEDILTIAALGLKKRLEHTGADACVLGLSGGLDSTLAALITVRALDMLQRPHTDLLAVTMPCFGTTRRTRSNAERLADSLGAALRTVDISQAVRRHFADIGQDMENQDVTFENAQARERTQVLMDLANQANGLVIGTGDLSELALGWCTYNGDQMSMYGVNSSIPKTLVRHVVRYAADTATDEILAATLGDILDTPVSPELLPAQDGEISQKTEDIVGPYELHDFFLYYFLRWGFPPSKILRLAESAFDGVYEEETIRRWLRTFLRRFFAQQFKRDPSPDGPKVGSVALSPRGDWRMPADAVAELWLQELGNGANFLRLIESNPQKPKRGVRLP